MIGWLDELIDSANTINYDLEHLKRDDDDEFITLVITVGNLKRLHAALIRADLGFPLSNDEE